MPDGREEEVDWAEGILDLCPISVPHKLYHPSNSFNDLMIPLVKSLFGRGDQPTKRKNSLANQIEMPAPTSPRSDFSDHWNEAEYDGFIDVERLELRRERSASKIFRLIVA